jgi:nucleoid-associated protein YgaU
MSTLNRYASNSRLSLGTQLGTAAAVFVVRTAIKQGTLPVIGSVVATGSDRLDTLAGSIYGDASLWWVLAAASSIGWGMQIPPGTVINVLKISDVQRVIGA